MKKFIGMALLSLAVLGAVGGYLNFKGKCLLGPAVNSQNALEIAISYIVEHQEFSHWEMRSAAPAEFDGSRKSTRRRGLTPELMTYDENLIRYADEEEFFHQNPDCCEVRRAANADSGAPAWRRVLGSVENQDSQSGRTLIQASFWEVEDGSDVFDGRSVGEDGAALSGQKDRSRPQRP